MAVYFGLLDPGDKILGMRLDQGGHLTHGSRVNFSGMAFEFTGYGVDPDTELVDMDDVHRTAVSERPKMIVAGYSAYSRILDWARFREIADEVGALLMVDAAHLIGLIAGGAHPNPVPHAHVVTCTTHKVLRGPRGGLILCEAPYGPAIDKGVFPTGQGGALNNQIAAKAVGFTEAAAPEFRDYAHRVVANARTLAGTLLGEGVRIVSGGTDNHLFLMDLRSIDPELTGKEAAGLLDRLGITVNFNAIPFDPRPPSQASGLRIGTPAATTCGLDSAEMEEVAHLIVTALRSRETPATLDEVKNRVAELAAAFPAYPPDFPGHV
jgi:glycine hydroxymethyltransferase